MTTPLGVGLLGAGAIGTFHGETLARRIPDTRLVMTADPTPDAAQKLASQFGGRATTDPGELIGDPEVDAVVIAAPAQFHTGLVVAAADAGKDIFCEKPMALTLADADRALSAAERAEVVLQVGFNRRFDRGFAAAHDAVAGGGVGTPHLLRSLTRDPTGHDPARLPPWLIYTGALIHDFDTLRYLNPGADAVEVHAMADTLIWPEWRNRGLVDTSIVLIRFDNGALATAEASFRAVYGYDVRGEVFGSAGMVTAGDIRRSSMMLHGEAGVTGQTWRRNTDLFHDAYVAELAHFVDCVRQRKAPRVTGHDARAALTIALAAVRSVTTSTPVRLTGHPSP